MKLLDTNVLIRFLLKDHLTQSPAAKILLSNFQENLLLTDVTLAETIWLLTSYYKLPKNKTVEAIYPILNFPNIKSNKAVLIRALYFYRNFSIDYIDAYSAAYAEEEDLEGIYSFDKDLDKIKEVRRFEPLFKNPKSKA